MSSARFHLPRRATQLAMLVALPLIPALGLFRIDLGTASLVIFDRPVTLRDFPVMVGLALVLATGPLLMVSTLGTFWCGWACPQNTVSEWANGLTRRLLGARASVSVEGQGLQVAPSKNRLRNWFELVAKMGLAALLLGLVPLAFFVTPGTAWLLLTHGETAQFSRFMERLYLVSSALAFANIAAVRYFLCNYACLYRFGVLLFRNRRLPEIRHDATRGDECARCNYCRVACITSIDPTAIKPYDRCVACGECVDACATLHGRPGRVGGCTPGLLRYEVPAGSRPGILARVAGTVGVHGLLCLGGVALMVYGLSR